MDGPAPWEERLARRFTHRTARVAVIGLGYVGLPLAVTLAEAGYTVIGIEVDPDRVQAIRRGESYVQDVPDARLRPLVAGHRSPGPAPATPEPPPLPQGRLEATTEYAALADCQAVAICVPTPLHKTGDPDISHVVAAAEQMAPYVHPGMLVVLESTTYPGTTREILAPPLLAAQPGLTLGQDLFVAFSPERIDPGRTDWTLRNTPKVVGGLTPACTRVAAAFYRQAVERVVPVSSAETAEMVKLFENTFRAVNIALANELLLMCDRLGLDAWEVVEAAATKPFGFKKFTPGPGLGGHCVPVDPQYLSWKMRTLAYTARFVELANEINTEMPRFWVQKVQDMLNEVGKPVKGSRVLVLGVAYKPDVDDIRESPALDIIQLLQAKGAEVHYHDPHVPSFQAEGLSMTSVADLEAALAAADCTVIVTHHSAYDWAWVRRRASLLVDTRHVTGDRRGPTP